MGKRKIVALLPMKAHSARVPNKNFKNLAGKPLFQWILDTLLSVEDINKVIINTDARDILEENGLKENGRIIIRDRNPELCGDYVSMNLIIADDIQATPADMYLMTHTTNPLLTTQTIESAIQKYSEAENIDSLFTVTKFQTRFYHEDTTPVNHDPNNLIRTQDLDAWYEENSCLYIFTGDSFFNTKARIGKKPLMMQISKLEAIDIDDSEDWEIADVLVKARRN